MTKDEIAARMRNGGVALAFDTNAIYDDRRFIKFCDRLAMYNLRLDTARNPGIRLIISAVAHAEKLFDLKQKFQEKFKVDEILKGLARKNVDIQAFESRHSLETAVRLGQRYPKDVDWHKAKRARYIAALGLPADTDAPATGKHCGATVDWLVGGHAQAEEAILVTNDTGPEFRGLAERVKLEILEDALDELLAEKA